MQSLCRRQFEACTHSPQVFTFLHLSQLFIRISPPLHLLNKRHGRSITLSANVLVQASPFELFPQVKLVHVAWSVGMVQCTAEVSIEKAATCKNVSQPVICENISLYSSYLKRHNFNIFSARLMQYHQKTQITCQSFTPFINFIAKASPNY